MRKALLIALPVTALVLAGCQKAPAKAGHADPNAGYRILQNKVATVTCGSKGCPSVAAAADAAAADPIGKGVTQIATSGSPRGYGLKLPPPHAEANGRSLTVSLPFRPADGLTWTVDAPGGPWKLTGSKTSAGAGPEGTDLAVFSFQASGPGSGALNFKLNPPKGGADNVMTYQATVVAP